MSINKNIYAQLIEMIQPILLVNKLRIGRNFDGGYVLSNDLLKNTDFILSLGINDEWSFEKDCITKFKIKKLVMIDDKSSLNIIFGHYLRSLFVLFYKPFNKIVKIGFDFNKTKYYSFKNLKEFTSVKYIQRRVGKGIGETSLINLMNQFNFDRAKHKVLLKIDIEGSEYSILEDIVSCSECYTGLVIEFHDILKEPMQFYRAISLLKSKFMIYHVHLNNYTMRNEYLSDAAEVSFINTSLLDSFSLDHQLYPQKDLDFPCNPELSDYELVFSKK